MVFYKKNMLFLLLLQSSMLFSARNAQEERENAQKRVNQHNTWVTAPIMPTEKVKKHEARFQDLLIKDLERRMDEAEKEYAKVIAVAAKHEEKEAGFKKYKHACIMAQRARTELERQRVFEFDLKFLKENGFKPTELITRVEMAKKGLAEDVVTFENNAAKYKKVAEKVEDSLVAKECKRYRIDVSKQASEFHKQLEVNERERQKLRYQEHELFRKHLKYAQKRVEIYQLALAKMNAYNGCKDGAKDPAVEEDIKAIADRAKLLSVELDDNFKRSQTSGIYKVRI